MEKAGVKAAAGIAVARAALAHRSASSARSRSGRALARGSDADRQEDLAKRMRGHDRRAHFLEYRRELRLARHRPFHLVSERRARAVRRELSGVRRLRQQARRANCPQVALANRTSGCPWSTRAEFVAASQSAEMKELRQFLADTVDHAGRVPRAATAAGAAEDARGRASRQIAPTLSSNSTASPARRSAATRWSIT